ncbi:hypothetical protein D3C71_1659330 [compost metagenome]
MQIGVAIELDGRHTVLRQLSEVSFSHVVQRTGEQALGDALGRSQTFRTMHHAGHFFCQHILGTRCLAAVLVFFFQRVDFGQIHKGEELQEAVHVGVGGVDPELVELVRAGFFRCQPDCATFGLAEFGAIGFGDQRHGQAEHLLLMHAAGQIDT